MNQPFPPYPHHEGPGRRHDTYATAPDASSHGFRYVVLACVTLVALAGLVVVGVSLLARPAESAPLVAASPATPTASRVPGTTPVVVPDYSTTSDASGSSCGSADGHEVDVLNGIVPCGHALAVAGQWLEYGTTPGDGNGSAGTMYSWSCVSSGAGGGYCTSRMGSHLSIRP